MTEVAAPYEVRTEADRVIVRRLPRLGFFAFVRKRPLAPDAVGFLEWSAIWAGIGLLSLGLLPLFLWEKPQFLLQLALTSSIFFGVALLSSAAGFLVYWRLHQTWQLTVTKSLAPTGGQVLELRFGGRQLHSPRAFSVGLEHRDPLPDEEEPFPTVYWTALRIHAARGDGALDLCIETPHARSRATAEREGKWLAAVLQNDCGLPQRT